LPREARTARLEGFRSNPYQKGLKGLYGPSESLRDAWLVSG